MIDDDKYVAEVCRPGAGASTCRYLCMGPEGWICAKFTSMRPALDRRVELNTIVAQGDNCEGIL